MTQLSFLISTPLPSEVTAAQQQSYVTYTLSDVTPTVSSQVQSSSQSLDSLRTITLLESASLLSGSGTTGLRTWEAALHLSTYLSQHPELINNKIILELGCGTGFISILCAKYLGANHVLATDGSPETLAVMETSLFLNGLAVNAKEVPGHEGKKGVVAKINSGEGRVSGRVGGNISMCELTWGHMLPDGEFDTFTTFLSSKSSNPSNNTTLDVILAADVIYSPAIIPSLIATFEDLFELYPKTQVLISSTIRNRDTYGMFLGMCEKKGWAMEKVDWELRDREHMEGPWYGGMGEGIEILWISNGDKK